MIHGGTSLVTRVSRQGACLALKSLHPKWRGKRAYALLLKREFEILSGLQHPALPRVFSLSEEALELEWISGQNLKALLPLLETGTSLELARRVATELLDILSYLRAQNLIHGDICLENLMLDSSGKLRLIDFGVARYVNEPMPAGFQVKGRERFRAPELLSGGQTSLSGDLYSAGVLIEAILEAGPSEDKELRACIESLKCKREIPVYRWVSDSVLDFPVEVTSPDLFEQTHCEMPRVGVGGLRWALPLLALFTFWSGSPVARLSLNSLPALTLEIRDERGEVVTRGETPLPDLRLSQGQYEIVFHNQARIQLHLEDSRPLKIFEDLRKLDTL